MMKYLFAALMVFLGAGAAKACNVPNPNLNAFINGQLLVDGCPAPASAINRLAQSSAISCPNIMFYGGNNGGVVDNTSAFNAVVAAAASTKQVCVQFPPGIYSFAFPLSVSLPLGAGGFTLLGSGPGVTTLTWPASGGGLTVALTSQTQSARFVGFDITTGVTAGGIAVTLTNMASGGSRSLEPTSVFDHVHIHGADGYSVADYWSTGIKINSQSNVNFDNVYVAGAATSGIGIDLEGISTMPAAQFNIISGNFECLNTGLIYGNFVQGVTVTGGTNFVCGNTGILVPNTSTNTDQLTIIGNSFNQSLVGIDIEGAIPAALQIDNNTFIAGNGSVSNAVDILVNANSQFTITHNNFQAGGPTSTGIKITNGSGVIQGNTFQFTTTGINLTNGPEQVIVTDDQSYGGGITTNLVNSGSSNLVNGSSSWTPVIAGSTTPGSPTYTAQIGTAYRAGHTVDISFEITGTSLGTAAGNMTITGAPFISSNAIAACTITAGGPDIASGQGSSQFIMLGGTIPVGSSTITMQLGANASNGSLVALGVANMLGSAWNFFGTCHYYS